MNRMASMMHETGNPLLRFGLLICVLGAFSPSQLLVAVESGQPAAATVVITQLHFQPDQMDVKVGVRVTWENQAIFTHTVTADDGSFDSGPMAQGKSWTITAT